MNLVFGSTNWKATFEEAENKDGHNDGKYWVYVRVVCTISIYNGRDYVASKSDTGDDFKTMGSDNWYQAR